MVNRNIVIGQRVTQEKKELAVRLRQNMTPAEEVLWSELRTNRHGGWHFRRQQIIDGFIVDFYCHAASLVIEVDGGVHEKQKEYDHERDAVLLARGLKIIRFSNDQVMEDTQSILAEIRRHLPHVET